MVISGPAGTGKSLACLLRLYHDATTIPGLRGLILRKTRASLTESALVTFERDVLGPDSPLIRGVTRPGRRSYRFPNASEIIVGGLDAEQKVMSTDFDRIYVQEAIELTEPEWETLSTRLGRRGDFGQLLADTNPDKPSHWLRRRSEAGKTEMLESRHEDNPVLWDGDAAEWTPAGQAYLQRLDALTGPRLQRLRFGRWVQAEGLVYDAWDAAVHLIDRFAIPVDWPRYLSIDFGFVNPFVCQWWAADPDGRLYCYREIYRTQRLVEDHAKAIRRYLSIEPRPRAIVCDTDAEDRATLERHLGMRTVAANKSVSPGIQAVAGRLKVAAASGRPRLMIMRDSLVELDAELVAAGKPTSTASEIDGYCWDVGGGRKKGEDPVKRDDHGNDAMRYMVAYLDKASPGWGKEQGDVAPPSSSQRRGGLSVAPDAARWDSSDGRGVIEKAPQGVWQ